MKTHEHKFHVAFVNTGSKRSIIDERNAEACKHAGILFSVKPNNSGKEHFTSLTRRSIKTWILWKQEFFFCCKALLAFDVDKAHINVSLLVIEFANALLVKIDVACKKLIMGCGWS